MKFYKTVIEGKNCFLKIEGREQQVGFFTTRVARGKEQSEAKTATLSQIERELKLKLTNSPGNPPEIAVIAMDEIDSGTAQSVANAGFTWYREDAAES